MVQEAPRFEASDIERQEELAKDIREKAASQGEDFCLLSDDLADMFNAFHLEVPEGVRTMLVNGTAYSLNADEYVDIGRLGLRNASISNLKLLKSAVEQMKEMNEEEEEEEIDSGNIKMEFGSGLAGPNLTT